MRIGTASRQRGFTLLEVLVATVVLSVALLGMAQMQLAGLRFAQDGTYRTQAILLASDMYYRILANQMATGVVGGTESYAGNATAANTDSETPLDCFNTQCSATDMANYDVAVWRLMILERIPNGSGAIDSTDGLTYTITVEWWDRGAEGDELQAESVTVTIPTT